MRIIYKLIIFALTLSLMSACTTGKRSTKDMIGVDGSVTQTVTNTGGLSQRTLRLQERVALARGLCALESSNMTDPERRVIARVNEVVIYSQDIPQFDMAGCIEESLRWGGERLMRTAISEIAGLTKIGVVGYAAASIAKRALDNTGVKVDGVEAGATVAIGTDEAPVSVDQRSDRAGDGSTYNSCAGEIIDGECVLPATLDSEEDEFSECELPDFCEGPEAYMAGMCGEIDPEVLACLLE